MYPVCPGSEGTLYRGSPGTMYLTAPGSAVHCTRSDPVHCTRTAPVCPGTMYPHCPPGDQSEARKSMTTNHGPPWGAVRVQCLRTAPQMRGSAGTMSPHCPPDEWQCRDNVSTLPWAVQKHCTHTTRGSMETLYGVTPNNVPGQPQYIVRGYPRQCRGSAFCLPIL